MTDDILPGENQVIAELDALQPKKFTAHDEDFNGANDETKSIMLAGLETEHRDLDAAILAIEMATPYERLTIARLKKKKLQLKDKIEKIKDDLFPDIIA